MVGGNKSWSRGDKPDTALTRNYSPLDPENLSHPDPYMHICLKGLRPMVSDECLDGGYDPLVTALYLCPLSSLRRADLSNCSHLLSRLQPSGHRASKHVQFLNAPLHKHRQLFAKIVFSIIGKYLKAKSKNNFKKLLLISNTFLYTLTINITQLPYFVKYVFTLLNLNFNL